LRNKLSERVAIAMKYHAGLSIILFGKDKFSNSNKREELINISLFRRKKKKKQEKAASSSK
jgi:hypothetical protein